MKGRGSKRLISVLLSLVMLLSLLPTTVFATGEDTTAATWTKVTAAPDDWSGTYLIVSEGDKLIMDGSRATLDGEGNKVDVTITDGKIAGDYAQYAFTIAAMEGGYSIRSASGKYISGTANKNKLNSGTEAALNTITMSSGNVIITSNGTTLQYNNAASNGTRFRYYKSQNQQPISLFALDAGGAVETVAAPTANYPDGSELLVGTKVEFTAADGTTIKYHTGDGNWKDYTDPIEITAGTAFTVKAVNANSVESTPVTFTYKAYTLADKYVKTTELATGDKVIIVNLANLKALSTEYTSYYNKGTDVTITDGVLAGYTDADVWTVGINEDGTYTFSTAEGKKLSMGTGFSSTPLDDVNTAWKISTAQTTDCFYIQNAARGNYIEWFSEKNNWSSYDTPSAEPLFAQQFFKLTQEKVYVDGGTPTPDPDPEPTPALADGDKVVIYNPANMKALSTEYDGYYNKGTDVTLTSGKFTGYTDADVWTVGVNADGTYTFSTADGKKLSMGAKFTSTPLDDVNTAWNISVAKTTGCYYIQNAARGNYLEWYSKNNNWSSYYDIGDNELLFAQAFYKVRESGIVTSLSDGDTVVIFNPANKKALSTEYSGFYNKGTDVTLADGKLTGYTSADIWTVGVNDDGTYTFSTAEGKKFSMGASYGSMPLDDVNTGWKVTAAATENCFYIQNAVRGNYIEWYAEKSNWSSYYKISDEALFAQQFYLVVDDGSDAPDTGDLPKAGDEVVIYSAAAQAALAAQDDNTDSPSITKSGAAEITDGKLTKGNGAAVFTVEKNGEYYRFYNRTYGYLCSNGTGNNAFYAAEASNDADWLVRTCSGGVGGFEMESRTAKYSGHSQWLEYYADSFKTYSMYNVTDYTIYSFFFYPVGPGTISDGVVNNPTVNFGTVLPAYVGQDYELTFTVDAPFGVKDNKMTARLGGDTLTVTLGEDGTYTATIPTALVTGDKLTVTVNGTDNKYIPIYGTVEIEVKDEPVITDPTPSNGFQTGDDKRPTIGATIGNAGTDPTVTLKVGGETVKAEYNNGKVTYTPTADMKDGRVDVELTVARKDGKTASLNWYFTVGKTQYQLYFGQLHGHTQYSDGSGSLTSALEYVKNLPDSANVDFVAFTDHSNYFDSKNAPNVEAALYDTSLVKDSDASHSWATYKKTIADFNASQSDIIAIGGFEMTWSGGPGHINTFNSPGVVSRNNTTLNNKTSDAGMKAYYALLSQQEGADTISQFNHPGTTFGNFSDFSYWDPVIDTRMYMVEVGNGEGQIGAGGYYPSYEQYIMALDKGWHVAPTNNQDNHKGKWGNANDARDVIITDNFTEEGIYEAIRAMRMYATEDKNLELGYTVNGQMMGSSITVVPDKLNINVTFNDPDKSDSISKVEIVVNSGKVVKTWDTAAELASGNLSVELDPDYSYYFVRVTQGDGDLAVTAPVWVGETLKLGISNVACGTSTPVTGEELTLTTTLFNSEAKDATIKSLTYAIKGGEVIGTDKTERTIAASSTLDVEFKYTPDKARATTITVTAVVVQDGKDYTFTKDIALDVLDADSLVYIGIDAAHYNEYVAGNYKDSMGNFGNLAAGYSVRTVELKTSADLINACSNAKYKALILTAPSRRLAEAQSDPRTYTADELKAITAFNDKGGTVILAGWSDNYENYDVIQNNPDIKHMAATQNELLAALGSSLRISDDATYDDVRSAADGVDKWRLYFSTYNMDNLLLAGVEVDADHPYDKLYTERFSHYGGASIYAVDAAGNPTSTLPATVSPAVYGHATTYSVDVDKDGLGGAGTPKYAYADNDSRLMVMATEQLPGKGMIVVSGAAFMSNFEVQATISDNGSEKNYSNYKICENLIRYLNPVTITDIKDVQAEKDEGVKFTVEGIVTSNASGYDKSTAFFDCIYVQDGTAGINCFPVAGEFKVGDKVRITGTTSSYQGERQLAVTFIEKVGEETPVTPKTVTAAQINDGSVLGSLVKIKGTVTRIENAEGLVQTIMVKDSSGKEARVFIDGYITTDKGIGNLKVGCNIEAVGLASWDNTFALDDTIVAPRIRIRDRADIVCTKASTGGGSGSGGSGSSGSSAGSSTPSKSFTTDLPSGSITGVFVNGKKLDSKYYVISGNTVTLTEEYMSTLKPGTYTIKIENATHVSTATFTVTRSNSPGTADPGMVMYVAMAVASVTGMAWLGKRKED